MIRLHYWRALIFMIFATIFGCGGPRHPYHAHWDGTVWSCPKNTDVWVDQKEATEGKEDFVYCVPKTKEEKEGIER